MNTPPRKEKTLPSPFSADEKEQLLENLDIEVANHRRRFEAYVEQALEAFTFRHETEITRIPRSIRKLKGKDFDALGGNVQAAVQAMAKQRIAEGDSETLAKKRKWQAAILEAGQEDERAAKTARVAPHSPIKSSIKHGASSRALLPKTPIRAANILSKGNNPKRVPTTKELSPTKGRAASPTKGTSSFKPPTTGFNPVLPKTPSFPRRMANQNESILSTNGTPLAFPRHTLEADEDVFKATKGSGIILRRDPSFNPSHHSIGSSATAVSSTSTGATITVSTHRGQVLQFDPLLASPGSLDRMPDLTDSAKKQVKDETARMIQALRKWHI